MTWHRWENGDLLLSLKVQPKSSSDGFAEVLDDAIKLRIRAAAVDGKANSHLVAWLAKQFGVAKSAVTIEHGALARRKRVRVQAPARMPPALTQAGLSHL